MAEPAPGQRLTGGAVCWTPRVGSSEPQGTSACTAGILHLFTDCHCSTQAASHLWASVFKNHYQVLPGSCHIISVSTSLNKTKPSLWQPGLLRNSLMVFLPCILFKASLPIRRWGLLPSPGARQASAPRSWKARGRYLSLSWDICPWIAASTLWGSPGHRERLHGGFRSQPQWKSQPPEAWGREPAMEQRWTAPTVPYPPYLYEPSQRHAYCKSPTLGVVPVTRQEITDQPTFSWVWRAQLARKPGSLSSALQNLMVNYPFHSYMCTMRQQWSIFSNNLLLQMKRYPKFPEWPQAKLVCENPEHHVCNEINPSNLNSSVDFTSLCWHPIQSQWSTKRKKRLLTM